MPYIPVTVNDKLFLAATNLTAHDTAHAGIVASVSYFSTRNGERFGPIRTAASSRKATAKSVGPKILAAVAEALNADLDAMIDEAIRLAATENGWSQVKVITKS